jgi:DNA-binding transcriptional ArsR family regulator
LNIWCGDATVSQLAAPFTISQPAISRHLKVLARAGLITQGRDAQWRPCRLRAAPLREVAGLMDRYRRFFDQSFDRLDDYLWKLQREEKKHVHRRA